MGVVKQNSVSPEKHVDRIFGNTFMMLRNIWMIFHFLDIVMMRKLVTTMIRSKLKYEK